MENPASIREILQDIRLLLHQIACHQRQWGRPAHAWPDGQESPSAPADPSNQTPTFGPADEDDLMTIREAYLELCVSRGTIDKLRKDGMLTSLYQNSQVRLLRSEVMTAKRWYSVAKGKI